MIWIRDVLGLLGLCSIGGGVYLLGGWPWLLISVGSLLFCTAVLGALISVFRGGS